LTTNATGLVKGFVRISMNDKGENGQVSDVISIQIWHYTADNKAKFFNSENVPYKKVWQK